MKFSHRTIIGEQLDDTLKSTLSNQYITYLGVSLLILYIGVYHRLDPETKETIQTKLTNPVIILAIITINFVLSFYNMLVAILLLVAIMITFSPRIKQSVCRSIMLQISHYRHHSASGNQVLHEVFHCYSFQETH